MEIKEEASRICPINVNFEAGIDFVLGAGILEQSMGARNRAGIGLSYRPAWLAGSIPCNRFQGSLKD